jgi:hypothetical protein
MRVVGSPAVERRSICTIISESNDHYTDRRPTILAMNMNRYIYWSVVRETNYSFCSAGISLVLARAGLQAPLAYLDLVS